ncbi:hypothetical protein H5410_026262 [Solanum commersonii]|uniref:Uncharacterized protein n=1 Tax=Solanum commersonii TaxID=4109 RepID=A0A9J5YWJ0_SOLCO|nr:hypothetical protein H5410_026262 [Solanum commersonii]
MPHESTNFSSSATMVHNDGSSGSGMQQSSHMSSMASMGHHDHGHGFGGSHPSNYSQSQKFNWALKIIYGL